MTSGQSSPRRPSLLWALGPLLLVSGLHFWLITYGTGRLTGYEIRGSAFDSLGRHLLQLEADVAPETINWEGFEIKGKHYIYYGPFPALIRIVPNLLFPWMYGQWSRVSCLVASILCLLAFAGLAARAIEQNPSLSPAARRLTLNVAILGFGLGTPLVYLVSCGRIYHEAVIWGLCGAIFCLYVIFRILSGTLREIPGLLLLSIGFAVTLLTRLTFALPIVLALALLTVRIAWMRLPAKGGGLGPRLAALFPPALAVLPAAAAVGMQVWYNKARFGSVWKTIDFSATYVHPETIGGTFNLRRIPSALSNYFGLHGSLTRVPPYFEVEAVRYADDSLFFEWKEHTFSLTFASAWLVLGAILGAVWLRKSGIPLVRTIALLLALESVLIAAFYFVTQRYASEFLPLLVFLFAIFLARVPGKGWLGRILPGSLLVLVVISSAVTLGSTLHWNLMYNGDAPFSYKQRLARLWTPEASSAGWSGHQIFLSELDSIRETHSERPMKKDTTWDGAPISFRGLVYERGIGMHANSEVTFAVPKAAVAFRAIIGLPDSVNTCQPASTVFELLGDGRTQLYRSPPVRIGAPPTAIRADLGGSRTLTLVVSDGGDGIDCDHGTWAMAEFLIRP